MPSIFDISPLSDTVALDGQGNGETAFTVSSHPDRARRGRAHIKVDPAGPAQASWFTIEDPEREFPIDRVKQVQQFTVRLKVPNDKAIKGSFKLVVASVRLPEVPDEHFTIGPPVGFEVKAVAPLVKRPFPWWIAVTGLAALLIAGGLVIWLMRSPSGVRVPDVVRQTRAEAERLLTAENLAVGTVTEGDSTEKPGTVISTNPSAASQVEAGSAVDLVISRNLVEVPPIIGQEGREAMKLLESIGLRSTVRQFGGGSPGVVNGQNPQAGTPVAPNESVELTVPARIPDLRGQPLQKAIAVLRNLGLRSDVVDETGAALTGVFGGQFVQVSGHRPPPGGTAGLQEPVFLIVTRAKLAPFRGAAPPRGN